METMFSPRKRTPDKKQQASEDDDIFPFKPSPDSAEDASAVDQRVSKRDHKKPVISATAMLMKYLPSTSAMNPPSSTTTAASASSIGGNAKPLSATDTPSQNDGWRTRAKPSETPPMSESERIARKYGLLPMGAQFSELPTVASSSVTPSKADSRQIQTPSPPVLREVFCQEPASETTTAKEAFWKSQTQPSTACDADTASSVNYVSPFGRKSSQFRDMRRKRVPTVDKETFYTDDATHTTPVNRPRHVIASKLTAGDDGKDDGWLSDAEEIGSDVDDALRHRPVAGTTWSRDHTTPGTRKRGRPRSTPPSRHDWRDEELDDDIEDEMDVNQWPRLPPPKGGLVGPLKLQSPTDEDTELEVCSNINSYLFDYQREGVQFLFNAYIKRTGAILGDEMGLGKTIQVISLLSAILGKGGDHRDADVWQTIRKTRLRSSVGTTDATPNTSFEDVHRNPILIVVPASLLHNWESELKVWMSCYTVILIGKPTEREQIIEQAGRGDYEIVICSYDVLKITLDKLKLVPWELIVLDEMHCLKNPESQLTQAVKAMRCPRKLGLTGTLMQNNEKELHCLIDTIAPGVLGSWGEFRAYYGDDIKYGRKKSAVPEAVERSRKKEKKLRQVLVPYYLRRGKEINPSFQEVKKCDQVVFCDLTPFQLAAYKRILAMPEFELLRQGEDPCDCGRESGRKRKECCYTTPASLGLASGERALLWERFHPSGEACNSCPNCMGLVCVAQLLKLSNHMELLKVNPRDPPHLQQYQADFAATAFGEDVDAVGGVQQVSTFQEMRALGTQTCGKMLVLEKLLALWKRKKQKTLLFSRSTRMLDILQLFLISKAITYLRLDGQTKVEERLHLVNRFNDPETNISVFLISTRAGGLGLNLPTATNVVIFDPSWNPAHDCQAQDRAYRIGQTKDVQVYRLITLGTIEEMIYVRQIYKQQLSDTTLKGVKAPRYFEGVQGDRRQQGELFGIKNLLCWKEGGVLKDIQDAYQRDRDDLLIHENQAQYTTTPGSGRKAKKAKTKQTDELALVDEEMVEVADEMVGGILSGTTATTENDTVTPSTLTFSQSDDDDDDDGVDLSNLPGARTLMHDNIVGEEDRGHYRDSLSESADEEADRDDDQPVVLPVSAPPPQLNQPPLAPTMNQPPPVIPETTASPAKPSSNAATLSSPGQKRLGLYIPKYL